MLDKGSWVAKTCTTLEPMLNVALAISQTFGLQVSKPHVFACLAQLFPEYRSLGCSISGEIIPSYDLGAERPA